MILSSNELQDTASVILFYREVTGRHYMNDNWNSLDEALHDCGWMDQKNVWIIHKGGLPRIDKNNLKIYLNILLESMKLHKVGPNGKFILPQRKIDLHVAFVVEGEDEKLKLQQQINEVLNLP